MYVKRNVLLGTTVLASILMASTAFAQEQRGDAEDQATEVKEIVVTGSRIRRDPANVPTPLIQVTGEQIVETGQATLIDYLATIPALSNSLVPSDTTGSGLNDGGLEFANLRSLGSGRTLTLVDGRRHVGSQAGTLSVDVSTIPRLLIQSIDIITGGASSIYGADAVSGVVNYTLRRDYEGFEVDANYGELVSGGAAATRRVSALLGKNFFDDRLNVYAFGEWEKADTVRADQIKWLDRGRVTLGVDADPTDARIGPSDDGVIDTALFFGARRLDRPVWGSTTLANMQQPSMKTEPLIPFGNCAGFSLASECFNVQPGKTWWFDGPTARLANFGQRIGNVGLNRPVNIGGDGEVFGVTGFDALTMFPEQEAQRYQVGLNFKVTDNIRVSLEAKYTDETAFDQGQYSFWDVGIVDFAIACGGTPFGGAARTCNSGVTPGTIQSSSNFFTRTDNAFLPANLAEAIRNNRVTRYADSTALAPGAVIGEVAAPIAFHRGFGVTRTHDNNRNIQRYVAAIEGDFERFGFIKDGGWSVSYTRGEMNNRNVETGHDAIRLGHALDSVFDVNGVVNGNRGEIVCRVQLLAAQGLTIQEQNPNTPETAYADPSNNPEIAGCKPLNVFGAGNQSAEALKYISASVLVEEKNVQDAAVAVFSGQLYDFWGAGRIGFSLGAEYRREYTDGIGRSRSTAGRLLQLNTGADFLGVKYETKEFFAELNVPLLRDHALGEYAELSGSYRTFDYSTSGKGDVYGVNLIYRPISDITFKASYNTSFRAPNLTENFRPLSETFVNGFSDPCDTRVIASLAGDNAETLRQNRVRNCTQLAAEKGLEFDFGQQTQTTTDDYRPNYSSGIASSLGGNPLLKPETSESLTFSAVIRPRFIPNLSLVLDYYEITIDDVISTPSGAQLANQCVNGETLDALACSFVFRNNPNANEDPFNTFKVGAPAGDPIGGMLLTSLNFAKLQTRGLDITVNYGFDTESAWGRDFGRLDWSLGALWLIEQKSYTSLTNRNEFSDRTTDIFFPRVEGVSRLTWTPNSKLRLTWTADWMVSQDISKKRNIIAANNADSSQTSWWTTGNYVRHDLTFNYRLKDAVTVRGGVTNLFDTEPPHQVGFSSSFDPYGRRYFVGLNYKFN